MRPMSTNRGQASWHDYLNLSVCSQAAPLAGLLIARQDAMVDLLRHKVAWA